MYSVLIVDDERMIRNGLRDLIPWSDLGVERVHTASGAREALALLDKEPVDILLTDICMPETTGIEMVRQLQDREQPLRTIVLTGYNDFEYAQQCCRMEVHDFLLKPINEEELIASLRSQIAEIGRWRAQEHKDKVKNRAEEMSDGLRLEWALRGLAHGEHALSKALDILERYGYDAHCQVQAALVVPRPQAGPGSPEETELHTLTVKHICLEMVDARHLGITFEDLDGRLGIVLFAGDGFGGSYSLLEQISGRVRDETGSVPKMILGGSVDGLDKLHISYNDAACTQSETGSGGRVYQTERVEKRMQAFYSAFENCKLLLYSNLSDEENLARGIRMLEALFEAYSLSEGFLRRCCFEVVSGAYFTFLQESGGEVDDRLTKTLELIHAAQPENALALTRDFLLCLFPKDANAANRIVLDAKQYINDNLPADLSVSSVAAHLYLNANYFSRLFKQTMGEGCNEYITRKRMERAKSLLENSSLKTGQVAEAVGYKDKNYFSLAFKKYTGLAPTAYRTKAWQAVQ